MKKIIKNIILILLLTIILPVFIYARGADENSPRNLTIYGLKGPSGVGIIRLFENPPQIAGFKIKVEALAQSALMAASFISGEAKVGILPPDSAAKIASSGKDIRVAAIIGGGMLNLLTSDPAVGNINDLRGKTVEVAGQGVTPDFVFRRILRHNGLAPDTDVKFGYSLAYPEIAQSLIAGRVSNALLPEPFATMARLGKPDLRSVADVQAEWAKAIGFQTAGSGTAGSGNFPMTTLVVDGVFATENPEAVNAILAAVKNSIEWVKGNPAEAGVLVEKHELGLRAPVVTAAIPRSNYMFVPAAEGRPSLEALFKVFLENAPASIGGALPGDRFYLR